MEGAPDHRGQIEKAIDAMLRPGQVTCEVLADNEMVIGARMAVVRLEMTVFTQRNASISPNLRGLTTVGL
jgi:hypothetical protein